MSTYSFGLYIQNPHQSTTFHTGGIAQFEFDPKTDTYFYFNLGDKFIIDPITGNSYRAPAPMCVSCGEKGICIINGDECKNTINKRWGLRRKVFWSRYLKVPSLVRH